MSHFARISEVKKQEFLATAKGNRRGRARMLLWVMGSWAIEWSQQKKKSHYIMQKVSGLTTATQTTPRQNRFLPNKINKKFNSGHIPRGEQSGKLALPHIFILALFLLPLWPGVAERCPSASNGSLTTRNADGSALERGARTLPESSSKHWKSKICGKSGNFGKKKKVSRSGLEPRSAACYALR